MISFGWPWADLLPRPISISLRWRIARNWFLSRIAIAYPGFDKALLYEFCVFGFVAVFGPVVVVARTMSRSVGAGLLTATVIHPIHNAVFLFMTEQSRVGTLFRVHKGETAAPVIKKFCKFREHFGSSSWRSCGLSPCRCLRGWGKASACRSVHFLRQ